MEDSNSLVHVPSPRSASGSARHAKPVRDRPNSSAVISSFGAHEFIVENDVPTRREEIVHAPPAYIRSVRRNKFGIRFDTKAVKRVAEATYKKNRDKEINIARCEKEFNSLMSSLNLGTNQPQLGFNMGDLLHKIGVVPTTFFKACADLKEAVDKTTTTVQNITLVVQRALPWISAVVKAVVLSTCAGVLVYAIIKRKVVLAITAAGVISAVALAQGFLYQEEITQLLEKLTNKLHQNQSVYNDPDLNVAHGDPASDEPLIPLDQSTISKVFVALFSCAFFSLGERNKSSFQVLKDYVVHFPSMIKGVDGIVEFCSKTALTMLNKIRSYFGYGKFDSLWEHKDPFLGWMNEVTQFLDAFERRETKPGTHSLGQINAYIQEGNRHFLFLKTITDDVAVKHRLSTVLTNLAKARDSCVHANPNIVASRPEPVCIYIYGKAGRGKTMFCRLLAQAWLSRMLAPDEYALAEKNFNAYVYHRTPETNYWDGYANQTVCIFDDFLQKREVCGGDSVALDIIRCLNNNPALLHMAALNDKGTTYFNSNLVILSSNMEVPNSEAIFSQEALLRRPDFWINLDLHPSLLKSQIGTLTYGDSLIEHELLAAINASNDWMDKVAVYKLQTYSINASSKKALPGYEISPLNLLDAVVEKSNFNMKKFRGELPSIPPVTVSKASNILSTLRAHQERLYARPAPTPDFENPSKESSLPTGDSFSAEEKGKGKVPESAWKAQVVTEGDLSGLFLNDATYKRKLTDWLSAIVTDGPSSPLASELESWLDEYVRPKFTIQDIRDRYALLLGYQARMQRHDPREPFNPDLMVVPDGPSSDLGNPSFFAQFFSAVEKRFLSVTAHVRDLFQTYWPVVTGAAAALAVGFVVYKTFVGWNANAAESVPARVRSRVPIPGKRGWTLFRSKATVAQKVDAPNSAQSSVGMTEQLTKVLKHTYHMFWEPKSESTFGHLIVVKDRIAITNSHTCDMICSRADKKGHEFVYVRRFGFIGQEFRIPVDRFRKVHRDEDTIHLDIVLVYLSHTGIPSARDVTLNMPTLEDLAHKTQLSIVMPDLVANNQPFLFKSDPQARLNVETTGGYEFEDNKYTNLLNITYFIHTEPGFCGLPVVTDSAGQGKYFAGIHKCGTSNHGGAAPLLREWYEREEAELIALYPDLSPFSHQEAEPQVTELRAECRSECYPSYTIGGVKPFHASLESKLIPLPHAHMFELSTAPAQLEPAILNGHWVSPYVKNRLKIPSLIVEYPDVPDLKRLISEVVNNSSLREAADVAYWRRTMTFEEAVFGIPGTPFKSLDMTTSVGYPAVLTGKTTKKAWVEDPVLFAQLRKEVDVAIGLLKRGIRPVFYVADFLKDERRTTQKAAEFSTRVIAGGAFVNLVVCRMFFGGFAAWTMINRIENGVTIGMNVFSTEVDALCRKLFKPNHKTFQGDSEAFDLRQHAHVERLIFDSFNDWYGINDEEGNRVRKLLSYDFMFARHVTPPMRLSSAAKTSLRAEPVPTDPFDVTMSYKMLSLSSHPEATVYEASGGDPSGHYLTALFNSWYSRVKPYIVLQYHVRDLSVVVNALHKREVETQVLGDDFITSVADKWQSTLNALTFSQFSESYGMKITREDKSPIVEAFPVEEPRFLKRKLYYSPHHGRYVGALDINAILDSCCWVRKQNPTAYELRSLFDTVQCELSFWGPETYNKWMPKIEAAARLTLQTSYVTWTWAEAASKAAHMENELVP